MKSINFHQVLSLLVVSLLPFLIQGRIVQSMIQLTTAEMTPDESTPRQLDATCATEYGKLAVAGSFEVLDKHMHRHAMTEWKAVHDFKYPGNFATALMNGNTTNFWWKIPDLWRGKQRSGSVFSAGGSDTIPYPVLCIVGDPNDEHEEGYFPNCNEIHCV